jgi:hypothetical protein
MRELREPTLAKGGFGDSRDIGQALGELTDISRMRSEAHEAANLFRDFHIEVGGLTERRLRRELSQAEGALARWAIMAAHEEFRTVDIARAENGGDWDATTDVEREIGEIATELFVNGEIEGMIERDSPEAKLRIMIDPGLLSGRGLIAVRRKRLVLAAASVPREFSDMRPVGSNYSGKFDPRGHAMAADVSLEIDKVSDFVLDFDRLAAASPQAAKEIRDVTEGGRVAGEITGNPGFVAPLAIEEAIEARDATLAPAVTTYYADRKYKKIRQLDQEGREAELIL